ncbi:MAG: right-handed parallel beta-helix repeat-containing protein [Clostridia bacterium]|nr:right-handed parallel beta-helix repeat-containing protein [Clostridia bacterium]
MKNKILSVSAALAAVAASAIYYYSFVNWIPLVYGLSVVLYAAAAGCLAARFAEKKALLHGLLTGGIFAAAFFALTFLINNIILFNGSMPKVSGAIIAGLTLAFFIVFYCVASRKKRKNRALAAGAFVLSVVLTLCSALPSQLAEIYKKNYKYIAAPAAGKEIAPMERELISDADFYVSPDGDDASDGSFEQPFATVEKARDAVRSLDKTGKTGVTVALKAGEYRVSTLEFTAEDSGTQSCPIAYRAYGDGEVILNGGVTLPHGKFASVTDEETLSRLSEDARSNVLSVDLFSLGVTAEQYGKLYAFGSYTMAPKYDGDWTGELYCELFIDDGRQTIARYPNGTEYLYTGEVVSVGQGRESYMSTWATSGGVLRNPEPDVYKLDKDLAERIRSWKTLDGVWMFGYFSNDWADASTPIGEIDYEKLTISPAFAAMFGTKKDRPYYFFNVLEELDAPGEWYLDRDNGILYFYPPEGFSENSTVELSLLTDNVIKAGANYLTFDGLTVKGTRGDAVSITGDGNTIENCLIKNVAGNALLVTGYNNLIVDNEITHTGKGGVILDGGDRETLRHTDNRAENNLVHDWSEIYETYQPAFTLNGVGNICAHNEIFNSPHEAITYSGNDHMIEYNLIHDVNLKTDDGGAIYSGRRWDWYGTVIRYNLIYDLGADGHKPVGIYLDDAIAGQTVYGNILVNAPNFGLQLGGGQDLDVHDNIVVNSFRPISFDQRALSGLSGNEDDSFYQEYKEGGRIWQLLYDSPWQSEVWQNAYPQYKHYSDDFSDPDNPDFVLNPAHCTVTHNLLISARGDIGDIAEKAMKYSTVEDNACFKLSALKKLFVDPENGDYTLRGDAKDLIGFEIDVPEMSEFGRR